MFRDRDPLNGNTLYNLAYAYFAGGRLQDAERTARELVSIEPGYSGARCPLAEILLVRGQTTTALATAQEEPDESSRLTCLADVLWKAGEQQKADDLLGEYAARYSESGAYNLAESYAIRDEKAPAFKWLNRAHENGEAPVTVMVQWDPLLQNLRSDPRFAAFLEDLKLPAQSE